MRIIAVQTAVAHLCQPWLEVSGLSLDHPRSQASRLAFRARTLGNHDASAIIRLWRPPARHVTIYSLLYMSGVRGAFVTHS
jgi:hypothetical protein